MKLGVLTHPIAGNYGGMLQAYAMVKILNELGHNAKLLDYIPLNHKKRFSKWSKRIEDAVKCRLFKLPLNFGITKTPFLLALKLGQTFKQKYIPCSNLIVEKSDIKFDDSLDCVVVGSDQVWRRRYVQPMHSLAMFFLDFLPEEKRRKSIAYAASFGTDDWEGTVHDTETCGKLLREFRAVGVREHSGCDICHNYFKVKACQVPDPTLLLTPNHYNTLIDRENTWAPKKDFLGAYILDNTRSSEAMIRKVAALCKNDYTKLNTRTTYMSKHMDFPLSPAQWLRLIRDCKHLITDSFHGCVFAIIFNKPFVCIGNKKRGTARFEALLSTFGLEKRLVFDKSPDKLKQVLYTPINWNYVNSKIITERERGKNFLHENLCTASSAYNTQML